ncbi:MAG: helix-turn-helix domain-containing protein [Gilvibacter sp.]
MNTQVTSILEQIPERHDFASYAMLLGITLSVLLAIAIFARGKKNSAIYFLGWTMLFQAIVFTDTFLCYTGLIKHMIIMNDSTEPFVLMIPVMFYLFVYCLIRKKQLPFKRQLPFYILPIAYALSQIAYYVAPLPVKLNAYLDAYHKQLNFATVPEDFSYGYQFIKDHFDWMILISFLFYGVLGLRLIWEERSRIAALPNQANTKRYVFTRNGLVMLFFTLIFVFAVFYRFDDDGGDHYIGIVQAVISLITVYVFLADSRFFEKSWFKDKYATMSSESISFESIEAFLDEYNYFLNQEMSLSQLAKKMQTNGNLISKTINSKTGMNFSDYINAKRINVAESRLIHSDFKHLTIEAIGNSVGFKSKSAFYAAFKKHTGTAPSSFIKAQKVTE